jgi:hypothetical protein
MGRYRASNCRCFHQPDDGDRQRAICQCADQVQIEEGQSGERRERLRQRPQGAHTGFLQAQRPGDQRHDHQRYEQGRQATLQPLKRQDKNNNCDLQQ